MQAGRLHHNLAAGPTENPRPTGANPAGEVRILIGAGADRAVAAGAAFLRGRRHPSRKVRAPQDRAVGNPHPATASVR